MYVHCKMLWQDPRVSLYSYIFFPNDTMRAHIRRKLGKKILCSQVAVGVVNHEVFCFIFPYFDIIQLGNSIQTKHRAQLHALYYGAITYDQLEFVLELVQNLTFILIV